MDDSIFDPDEDIDTSDSDNEAMNTQEMLVDHKEEVKVANQSQTEHDDSTGEKSWVRNKHKRLQMEGKAFKGMTKDNGKWGFTTEKVNVFFLKEIVPNDALNIKLNTAPK